MSPALLDVQDLRVRLKAGTTEIAPVDGVTFSVARGEALGIVGESGSGKSLTLKAILGLLPLGSKLDGSLRFSVSADDVEEVGPDQMRGRGVSMIFQEPMTALNPTMRVGRLVAEGARGIGLSRRDAKRRSVELLDAVGVPNARERSRMWPHELSGGLRQRVMIAAALSTEPALLLCDEPTTALDVTVQDQILGPLAQLRRDLNMAMVFVTHDLAVIAEVCDRIAVMYAGRIVELGSTQDVLAAPQHPYTAALLASAPSFQKGSGRLEGIGGQPPDPRAFPPGCRFAPRCRLVRDDCHTAAHQLTMVGSHETACVHPELLLPEVAK